MELPLGSDGECTGFPEGVGPFDWSHCCVIHDAGGSDGQLADCISKAVPGVFEGLVYFCIMLMIFARPVYNVLQRWGWMK